jgi:oligopeptide transport system ATP-binding protein
MNIYKPTSGKIFYQDVDTCDKKQVQKNKRMLQTTRQMIFQDSSSSLNQRMKVADIIAEPMAIHHITPPRKTLRQEAEFQLKMVGMDVSIQAQIVNLFKRSIGAREKKVVSG